MSDFFEEFEKFCEDYKSWRREGISESESFDIDEDEEVLEFISDDGVCKVRFIFKNKKYTTSGHLRMIDALQELKTKLEDYGFILKICNCCSHFTSSQDGSTNMVKGVCSCDYPSPSLKEPKPTLIWNTCSKFSPAKLNSLIEEVMFKSSEN